MYKRFSVNRSLIVQQYYVILKVTVSIYTVQTKLYI